MARCRRHLANWTAVASALFLNAPFAVGQAAEPVQIEFLWLPPPGLLEGAAAAPDGVPALLNLPPGWTRGDAAAVLVGDRHGLGPWRERLAEALLNEGAAVLELEVQTRHGAASPESSALTHLLLRGLSAALSALYRDAGAGLVVAIGCGAGGEAALLAGQEARMPRHLGTDGPRLAASAALEPGRPAFVLGAAPAVEQEWPARAPLLCAALSAAVRAEVPPSGDSVVASERADMERDCLVALLSRSLSDSDNAGPAAPRALAAGRRR